MTRLFSLRKCLYIIIIHDLFIYSFIILFTGGEVAILIYKPSKYMYMQMTRAQILQTDLNTFPLLRVIGELDKISACTHLPFHDHFYNSHNILSLCCIDIARREQMLVTHDPEGLRPKPYVPHCLETFADSFFDEFVFVIGVYEINQASLLIFRLLT